MYKVISNKEHPIQRPSWGLAPPKGTPSPSFAKVICGGIVRDFRGQFISVLVDSLLEIT